jgi:peptidyl-prolyl cis-trans isomerase SurA
MGKNSVTRPAAGLLRPRIFMKKLGLPLLLFVFLLPAIAQQPTTVSTKPPAAAPASSKTGDDTVVEEIVARINNAIVTRADLRHADEQLQDEIRQQNPPNPDEVLAQRRKDQLRDLINQQLLVQKGIDLGYTADTELIKRLDEIRKQVGAATIEDLEPIAKEQGVSFEDFKNNLKNQIITQQVIGREVGSHIQISQQEIKDYYDAHKEQMSQPEQVRLSEILIPVALPKGPDGKELTAAEPDPQAVAAALATAEDLEKQLKGGAKFEDLAKANSKGPTADQGGDLGYFKRGMLAKELEDKTFALKAGEFTDPIRTKQGFVILKATDHTAAGVPDLKVLSDRIQERLYYQRLEPALQDYFKKLREDAYIYVKPGYVDTGAVATQSGPVFTDDQPKKEEKAKKKKHKRFIFF